MVHIPFVDDLKGLQRAEVERREQAVALTGSDTIHGQNAANRDGEETGTPVSDAAAELSPPLAPLSAESKPLAAGRHGFGGFQAEDGTRGGFVIHTRITTWMRK